MESKLNNSKIVKAFIKGEGADINADINKVSEFCEAAMLNKKHDPWMKRRKPGEYVNVEITNCQHKDWWYKGFIGIQFLGIIKRTYAGIEVSPVRLTNTTMVIGRDIPMSDLIML